MKGVLRTPQPGPQRAPRLTDADELTFAWQTYGDNHSLTFRPNDYAVPVLAAQLGRTWLEVIQELHRMESNLTAGLQSLLKAVSELPLTEQQREVFDASDLRRSHLDLWELRLVSAYARSKSDTAYRKAVYLFALLRRFDDDNPGMLHPSVRERLENEPRLRHHRNDGMPALLPGELRTWRRWAYLTVRRALGQDDRGAGATDTQCAQHVLLSLGTGEPPEVIRAVTIDDIVATTTPEVEAGLPQMTPAARLAYLAEHDLVEQFAVTYTKKRANESYLEVYGRRDHEPFKAFRWAVQLNAHLREESALPPLVLRRSNRGVRQPPWARREHTLQAIATRNDLPLTGPNAWARLRKNVVAREVLADPRAYLRSGGRHSSATFFGHYTNSTVLRAEAGKLLVDGITTLFDRATAGPTVITPDAERVLRDGTPVPGMAPQTVQALLQGDLDGPQAGCRDPLDSPFQPPGTACNRSMTGTCFGCGNALITRHHLPAALAILDLADPDRAADPQTWMAHWRPIHEAITNVILPEFSAEDIAQARETAHLTPLDLGTSNDMRGTFAPTPEAGQ